MIKGNILETLPMYEKRRPEFRIALMHIDVDVYEPTKYVLDDLFDRVVRGGVIIFDDYSCVVGATQAVDEFLQNHPRYVLSKYAFSHAKPSYIIKT